MGGDGVSAIRVSIAYSTLVGALVPLAQLARTGGTRGGELTFNFSNFRSSFYFNLITIRCLVRSDLFKRRL